MSNSKNEINEENSLLKEIFHKLSKENNFLPIIKTFDNIRKIIPFLIDFNTNKEEDIKHNINLLSILKDFFNLNNNLIPLFMKISNLSNDMTFYECLINLYLNVNVNESQKQILEELIKIININYSLSKNLFEFIYQKLSKYFKNNAKEKLTDKLFSRYLNLLSYLYTDSSIYKKKKKQIKNYIYFNGINSGLSFLLNKSSCNLNTDFPTLEKGCTFVFWINLDKKLIEEYFKILPDKTFISFIKINVGGQVISLKLINPDNIVISTQDNLTNKIEITNLFNYNEWNNIIFIIEPSKGQKLTTKIYINNNLINGTLTLKGDLNPKEKINNINLFENLLGKITSVLYFSFSIDNNLINYFSSIQGFYKNKILLQLLSSFDKEYPNINSINSKNNENNENIYIEKLNQKIKIKLVEQNINNLICCFCPLTYQKNRNLIDDVFGNFIGELNNIDGVINYINKNKNIRDLGGINNLLPIIELMLSSLKNNNPYNLIDNNILTERTFQEFLLIVQRILIDHEQNFLNEKKSHFFSCLSLFMEKIPSKFYSLNVLQSIIGLINLPLTGKNEEIKSLDNKKETIDNSNIKSNNFINLILLNERIITKFTPKAQIELWEGVYDIFKKDLTKLQETLSTPKICLLLRFYDEKRYEQFCCYKHACLFNNGNISENKSNIMYPDMNIKVGILFQIIQLYIDKITERNQVEDIFKLLSLDLSPCLQKKIINLYISHFKSKKVPEKVKEQTLIKLLKNKYFELSEYVLKVSLLDVRIEIFKLFNLFITKYKQKLIDYLDKHSVDMTQIFCFIGYNLLPNKLIVEIDLGKKLGISNDKSGSLMSMNELKKTTTINEALLNQNKKYVKLIDFFDKKEYDNYLNLFWSLLNSSIKYDQSLSLFDNNLESKDKKMLINPFVFIFSIDFASKVSAFYINEFLKELISLLKDEEIANKNIFHNDKIFFPWLIDTIFYFHNTENYDSINNKEVINSIQKMSIDILCDLFSKNKEQKEISRRLKYILDYSYYYKNNNPDTNKLKENLRITRFILLKSFECLNDFIDTKSKICFEFMILYNNSKNIFPDAGFQFKEINPFTEKDFLEMDKLEDNNIFNSWETVDRLFDVNKIMNSENDIVEDNLNIGSINDEEEKESNTFVVVETNVEKNKEANDLNIIPEYIYDGINQINNILFEENTQKNDLESIWTDYKLFYYINDYYRKNVWGLECLCKKAKKNYDKNNFETISKELYKFFGEVKENKNSLIKEILKHINFQDKAKKKLNVFYLNLILLTISIDICQTKEEKEDLYSQYEEFLFFFVLSTINLIPNNPMDNKNKKNNKFLNFFQAMFYNIIGYGFLYLKEKDKQKYNEIKSRIISPFFAQGGKKIFTNITKNVIGKLFINRDSSKDDSNLDEEKAKQINRHSRATTMFSRNTFFFNRKKAVSQNIIENDGNEKDNIIFRGDSNAIINEIIEGTVSFYKNEKIVSPQSHILEFYKKEINEESNFIGMGYEELNLKVIEEEKRIYKTLKEIIPFLENEVKKYWNNSCLDQLKRRRDYKKTKKKLFSWNGFWSDRKLFFEHPEYLKLTIKNHFTKEMTKVVLSPILDIDYYLPKFKHFNKDNLFNKDNYKYVISLNVEEILKIEEDENKVNKLDSSNINIENNESKEKIEKIEKNDKNEENKDNQNEIVDLNTNLNINEINKKEESKEIENKEKEKKVIKEEDKNKEIKNDVKDNKNNEKEEEKNKANKKDNKNPANPNFKINNFGDKIKFFNERFSQRNLQNKNMFKPSTINNNNNSIKDKLNDQNNINSNKLNNVNKEENKIKSNDEKKINKKEDVNNNNNKINLNNTNNKKENGPKNNNNIKNCLTKDFNYLESLYKFTFKGIWDQYTKFYKGKMTLGNIILGNKDTFDILIHSKLMSSSAENIKNENLYICCIVKPTHHVKGYMSTEKTSIKFTHCDEDEESQRLLEDDPSYDKEMRCCFGSTFKSHLKDNEKVCIEIKYSDMRYILFRNYFYQDTACEIYTFLNKSYFLNFKNKKELQKFTDDLLNHETFRLIEGEDFKGRKILGYEKTADIKAKPFKVRKLMEDWQANSISTLEYIMWLNIFSGRSFNDLTQYPVLPWLITNYNNEELKKEDFRDLSIPIGMLEVNEKAMKRKEIFDEFYETLKTDFKEANPDFNYSEYLKKPDEYLEDYKSKKKKKKKDNKDDPSLNDEEVANIEYNQIPFFYGTHYSCPTFISHYLMRLFPFALVSIEIQGNKFDDPDRIFISLTRTFETASTLKEDVRELIPEFYTLPDMFLNKNNLNLTQDKLDAYGQKVVVHDVELPPWCNNISYNFVSEMRKNLEKNELKINKWIDLIFGSLQRGEKAEENHNIFMAQSYENMVKIDTVVDYDSRNALMRLAEVGITPKQLFKNDTKPKSDKFVAKGYLFQTQKLFKFPVVCQRQEEITKKLYTNKSINKEYKQEIYSKIIKIKSIGPNELLLLNNLNYLTRLKFKGPPEKLSIEEKIVHQALNISSKYSPSYSISEQKQPIIFYNNNKYMIKGGFWDGRLEINSIILDSKEKEKHFSNCVYINEGPIVVMEMTKDEKILLCGTKTGFLICFSVNGHSLSIKNKIYIHNDEITSININDNLNMFATSSLDGYINLHILPSFDLIRSIKISICNLKFNNYGEEFYYANNVFLSSCPLPCVTAFISTKKIFRTLTINGEFIEDREEDSNFINCPILFNDLNFQDYIIYGTDDGMVKVRSFPNLDLINSIQPYGCNEIVSLDISQDKKYCYLWNKDNKIFVIKDLYTNTEEEQKKKLEKNEKDKEIDNEKENEKVIEKEKGQ